MFGENLKTLRKQKGFSQEELAVRLHVVRQTVSKWEKNLSVPDADTLIRLAEILEVSVSELLGAKIENENTASDVAEQLSRINEQLAIKNRRSRRIWKIVAIILVHSAVLSGRWCGDQRPLCGPAAGECQSVEFGFITTV